MPEISLADITALLPCLLIGFLAQAVDGALGMAFGVIVNAILVGFMGVPPALASTHVDVVKCLTSAASGLSHQFAGNIDFQLFLRLLIPGVIGGILTAPIRAVAAKYFLSGPMLILVGIVLTITSAFAVPKGIS